MNRELIEDLHEHFEQKSVRSHHEEQFYGRLSESLPHFEITTLHRDDLISRGFDAAELDDSTMKELAQKMGSAYTTEQFWLDLDILAEGFAKRFKCPRCWGDARQCDGEVCYCLDCENEWKIAKPTGYYVKVEHPEDSSFFEDNEIGFECYNSDDNSARYVPQHIYTAHFERKAPARQIYLPITWPQSQRYLEWKHTSPARFSRCEYINPATEYGENALFVPQKLIDKCHE